MDLLLGLAARGTHSASTVPDSGAPVPVLRPASTRPRHWNQQLAALTKPLRARVVDCESLRDRAAIVLSETRLAPEHRCARHPARRRAARRAGGLLETRGRAAAARGRR